MININKVTIVKGAVYDYEEIVCKTEIDYNGVKKWTEHHISDKEENKETLRMKYNDPRTGKELMLFIRRGYKFGIMQMWILEGICETKDYDERMETDGSIEKWLEVEIE